MLAVVFIVAAILGGGGDGNSVDSAAPPVSGSEPPNRTRRPPARSRRPSSAIPAFATKNTTRVGGDDAAANAAGAALAVFPSTDDAQRPAAVTLVDEADARGRDRRLGADGGAGAGADPDLRRATRCR